jgi:hypothetical protein
MVQKNDLVRADSDSGDDNGFIDIDELLSGVKQESINSGSIAEKVDSGTRGGSLANSTRLTEGSSQGEHPAFPYLARTTYSSDPRSNYAKRRRICGRRV